MPSETFPFQTAWFCSNPNRADWSQKHTFAIPHKHFPHTLPTPIRRIPDGIIVD
ncbi:hypothetical protein [Neisseria benedictiae]|uniref:hypothetical protein n=1 Tax=Neisseria benedictiae TaxID=2830649 RepID=UPI00265981C9|nr:hypothetical protein [Neisseria benedictiae]